MVQTLTEQKEVDDVIQNYKFAMIDFFATWYVHMQVRHNALLSSNFYMYIGADLAEPSRRRLTQSKPITRAR